jgi:CHAD domain-containing protein
MSGTDVTNRAAGRGGNVAVASMTDERGVIEAHAVDSTATVLQSALAAGLEWLRVNAPRAHDGDVEGVHHLRVTTRRLRSTLELFSDMTSPAWTDDLSAELKWLGEMLGEVRDLDVLRTRLKESAGDAAGTGVLSPLLDDLEARWRSASDALRNALGGERFRQLESRLVDAAAHVPLRDDISDSPESVLSGPVARAWKNAKRGGRALSLDDPAEDFHEVRKRVKRVRYAAEGVADFLEPDEARSARRFARAAKRVQDVLGAHQDAVVAGFEIRKAAAAHPELGPFNFAAGRLHEREERAAVDARARFFDEWRELDRKKLVAWM